uniref:Uncharacterized protein n=1 Tax=Eptatretus burgeri TaxID=7764 RepID=A0A8C4R671_EPTBU
MQQCLIQRMLLMPHYPSHVENSLQLLHLVQDLLLNEGQEEHEYWSEKMLEGIVLLMETLSTRLAGHSNLQLELTEATHITLRLLLGFVAHKDMQVCAAAAAKLHITLQARPPVGPEEAGFLLGRLDDMVLKKAAGAHTDSFLVPILRILLDRCDQLLGASQVLPTLTPANGSPTFLEDFRDYCSSIEWRVFVTQKVQPLREQFEMANLSKRHDLMSCFWNSCFDALMISSSRRDREENETKARFQELVVKPKKRRAKAESVRYNGVVKAQQMQLLATVRQWRLTKQHLMSERGPWADRFPMTARWKRSDVENSLRMRLKLVRNFNFDQHLDASALRDNHGMQQPLIQAEELPLHVAKEAKVNDVEEVELKEDEDSGTLASLVDRDEESGQREKLVLSETCELITVVLPVPGRLEVTTQHLYFYDLSSDKGEETGYDFKIPLWQLREIHLRWYNLRRSALELFFINNRNYFLNFNKEVRSRVYNRIVGLGPPNLAYLDMRTPQELFKTSGLTQKWVNREICNFEYLMQINTIAGRSYNDLAQYPVFPWVLSDYTSEYLDLSNPDVFRDLSKPVGVVSERNAKEVKERYENFEDPTGMINKFHYGTHYSNAAGVMHYLIRVEPFTSLHIQLQSDRFDCADRQFHSIPATWFALMDSPNDVKELIPEFFYFPDFLKNDNALNLGTLQLSGDVVDDVVLPKWAKSPEDFIRKHRDALESEHVSAHLHEWIDLIFGYKQQGSEAIKAQNVFYYCTYVGAVDPDNISDEMERKALEGMISNFGQTPSQLLKEPHPPRLSTEEAARRQEKLDSPRIVFQHLADLKCFFEEGINDDVPIVKALVPKSQPRSFITQGGLETLVTVSADCLIGTHGWLPFDKNISNYFTFSKDPTIANIKARRYVAGPMAPGMEMTPKLFAVSHDGKLLFSAGSWDNSVRVLSLKGKSIGQCTWHIDVVTCLALDECGINLISGSRDTTCVVWKILYQGGSCVGLGPKPQQILYGHNTAVTSVAISAELDIAISGASDGTVLVHYVHEGLYIRTLHLPCEGSPIRTIPAVAISSEGYVVIYSNVEGKSSLKVCSDVFSFL